MKRNTYRILYTSSALLFGICIVLILSFAGNKSYGPLENLLSKFSSTVHYAENILILHERKTKRSDKLRWFRKYRTNISLLKNPKIILLGVHDNQSVKSFESVIDLEDSMQITFPLIQIYLAWGSKPEEQFPKLKVEAILELGSIPVITWEPWLTDFDSEKYPNLRKVEERDQGGLAEVAKGVYDNYLKQWAKDAKEFKQPIFLRFGHEMNDPYRYPWGPQNNTPKDFTDAWKHIHDLFQKEGAVNIIWIWNPHPAYGYFDAFFPGKEYVDYVGVGILNFGNVATWSQWWTFSEMFDNHYKELTAFNKPLMITEFGSLICGGDRDKWFRDALSNLPQKYPAIKSILFFHVSDDKTTTQQSVSWYFKNDRSSINAITGQIKLWPDSVKPGNGKL